MVAAFTGLGTGEAYYFRGAEDPQLSYFDQPPLFFWIAHLSTQLLGDTTFGLRIPFVLLFSGTTWLIYLTTKKLFDSRSGFFAAITLNISVLFMISIGSWFQPDAPLIFFWALSVYIVIHIFFGDHRNSIKWWILAGVSLGLAGLSKYHAAFLYAGLLIFLIIDRRSLRPVHLGYFLLAALIIIMINLPTLVWNVRHDWASLGFQVSRAGTGEFSLHPEWLARNILGQAAWISPWIWAPLIWQLVRSYKRRHDKKYALIFWLAVLPIAFFTIINLWTDTKFHFHWQAPGYFMLFIPLGAITSQKLEQKKKKLISWLTISTVLNVFILTILAVHTETGLLRKKGPFKEALSRIKEDPTLEGYDFDDIRYRFEEEDWLRDPDLFVGSTRWWQCGKIDWALKAKKPLIVFHNDPRNHIQYVDPRKLMNKDAIIISRGNDYTIENFVKPFFEEVEQLEDLSITRNGYTELNLQVYYAREFRIPEEKVQLPLYYQLKGDSAF